MFNLMHCNVCRAEKKFRIRVDEARGILYRLDRLLQKCEFKKYEKKEDTRKINIRINSSNYHSGFCGHCPKINTMELKNLEDKIKKVVSELTFYKEVRGECSRLLSGYYPELAQIFLR